MKWPGRGLFLDPTLGQNPRLMSAPAAAPHRDLGTGLIVLYKALKAAAEVALLLGMLALARGGEHHTAARLAAVAREHLASRWSLELSEAVGFLASGRGQRLAELGLALDGLLTALEGWSLWRGYRWGPWLVVCASLLPLPWELWELGRGWRWSRVALIGANLAVAGYLAWRIARRGRGRPGRAGEAA